MRDSYQGVGQRFGLEPDLSDAEFQLRLEELKEVITATLGALSFM